MLENLARTLLTTMRQRCNSSSRVAARRLNLALIQTACQFLYDTHGNLLFSDSIGITLEVTWPKP